MATILVIDDDESMRRLIRLNLADCYEVVDTGEPERALALALEHKPAAILLDLRMPRYSGFELCQTFTSFSSTQLIPVLVVSGEAGTKTKEFCRDLGAAAYFEKPVDFEALRVQLAGLVSTRRKERRSEVRVRLRVALRLSGKDKSGEAFGIVTNTENLGRSSFFCGCGVALATGSIVEVHIARAEGELAGRASVIRSEWNETQYPHYAFRFTERTGNWVLT